MYLTVLTSTVVLESYSLSVLKTITKVPLGLRLPLPAPRDKHCPVLRDYKKNRPNCGHVLKKFFYQPLEKTSGCVLVYNNYNYTSVNTTYY